MNHLKQVLILGALSLASFQIYANTVDLNFESSEVKEVSADPYFTISNISVTELDETEKAGERSGRPPNRGDGEGNAESGEASLGPQIGLFDTLMAFGDKVWKIVKGGIPVFTNEVSKPISIIPNSENPLSTFQEMQGWKAPLSKRFKVEYTNMLGMTVISFEYAVVFQAGGNVGGKGNYLTGLTLYPSSVDVSWGYKFDVVTELSSVSNSGTTENPVAAGVLSVRYKASSYVQETFATEKVYVTGLGEVLKY